jgi:hypothetical protein
MDGIPVIQINFLMGASTSRLRQFFHKALEVTDLPTAFNFALVFDGIRPSFQVSDAFLSPSSKLIELYAPATLNLQGQSVSLAEPKPDYPWPSAFPSGTPPPTSLDSNLYYRLDGFIVMENTSTKTDQAAVFYTFEAPEPLSQTNRSALYRGMLKAYHLAVKLSDDQNVFRTDLAYHSVLSPSLLHKVASLSVGPQDLEILLAYLERNGFGYTASQIKASPRLTQSPAFRQGVLNPILTFESSGVMTSLNLTPSKRGALGAQKTAWEQALFKGVGG